MMVPSTYLHCRRNHSLRRFSLFDWEAPQPCRVRILRPEAPPCPPASWAEPPTTPTTPSGLISLVWAWATVFICWWHKGIEEEEEECGGGCLPPDYRKMVPLGWTTWQRFPINTNLKRLAGKKYRIIFENMSLCQWALLGAGIIMQ